MESGDGSLNPIWITAHSSGASGGAVWSAEGQPLGPSPAPPWLVHSNLRPVSEPEPTVKCSEQQACIKLSAKWVRGTTMQKPTCRAGKCMKIGMLLRALAFPLGLESCWPEDT